MSFFKGKDFTSCKKMTDPVYAAPSCIREMLDIAKVYEDGIFEIETDGGKNRPRLFDKVYEFSDGIFRTEHRCRIAAPVR